MSQLEAWIVTALGMGVVFAGLVLCILFINVFNRMAQHVTWGEEGHGHAAPAPPPSAPSAPAPSINAPAVLPTVGDPLTPELQAVIATALEIEYRLSLVPEQRLTIRRTQPISR